MSEGPTRPLLNMKKQTIISAVAIGSLYPVVLSGRSDLYPSADGLNTGFKVAASPRMEQLAELLNRPYLTPRESMNHVRAFEAERAALAKPGDTPAEKLLVAVNKQQIERLKHLLRTCHALAKNSRPFTDYIWLCELDAQKMSTSAQ